MKCSVVTRHKNGIPLITKLDTKCIITYICSCCLEAPTNIRHILQFIGELEQYYALDIFLIIPQKLFHLSKPNHLCHILQKKTIENRLKRKWFEFTTIYLNCLCDTHMKQMIRPGEAKMFVFLLCYEII